MQKKMKIAVSPLVWSAFEPDFLWLTSGWWEAYLNFPYKEQFNSSRIAWAEGDGVFDSADHQTDNRWYSRLSQSDGISLLRSTQIRQQKAIRDCDWLHLNAPNNFASKPRKLRKSFYWNMYLGFRYLCIWLLRAITAKIKLCLNSF